MIQLGQQRRPFRLGLTPMIDVVFLLLVFFMLAARFGFEDAIVVSPAVSGGVYDGPPRLVTVSPEGTRLNGQSIEPDTLATSLLALMTSQDDAIVIRPIDGVSLQSLVDAMAALNERGFSNLVIVE